MQGILKGIVNFSPALDLNSKLLASAQLKRQNINAVILKEICSKAKKHGT